MSDNTQQSQPIQRIWGGKYRELKVLNDSEGNFAIVFLVKHIHLNTSHAMKVLRTALITEAGRKKFEQEAQLVAHLKHPHIVRVTDYGIEPDGTPFIVMDYAPNGSLRNHHPRGTRLPLATIISYIKQLSSALHYAHVRKIIHCDIKPENMLLGEDNEVLLSDFGLAIIIASSRTDALYIAGTAVYMSPEQFRGKEISAACDQYGLAVVVYEWLCGEPPFIEGNFMQLGFQHTYDPPRTLQERVPSILPKIQNVVLKALSKDPKDRYPDILAFADALEAAIKLPGEEYYKPHVAAAMRDCYYRYAAEADWGEMREITSEDAKPHVSHRGTQGYRYLFTRGAIYWSERGGAQPLWGDFSKIHLIWEREDGDYLGFPLTSELPASNLPGKTEGVFQRFEGPWDDYPEDVNTNPTRCGASLYFSDKYKAHLTWGSIGLCYERLHGTAGKLGFPRSGEEDVEAPQYNTKGKCQKFEGGEIYWIDGAGESYPTWGAIGWQYQFRKHTYGRLGFPLSLEIDLAASTNNDLLGRYQRFQGGTMYWKNSPPYDDVYPVWGGIARCYERSGEAAGFLGFPTSSEKSDEGPCWYQSFEHGDIYWRDDGKYDGIVVQGSILQTYKHFGGLKGKFGFPKSPEAPIEGQPELRMQEFEGGVICVVKE